MGGGAHSFGFSSYEGAVRRAKRADGMKQKNPRGVFLLHAVSTVFDGRGLRLPSDNRSQRVRCQNHKERC